MNAHTPIRIPHRARRRKPDTEWIAINEETAELHRIGRHRNRAAAGRAAEAICSDACEILTADEWDAAQRAARRLGWAP